MVADCLKSRSERAPSPLGDLENLESVVVWPALERFMEDLSDIEELDQAVHDQQFGQPMQDLVQDLGKGPGRAVHGGYSYSYAPYQSSNLASSEGNPAKGMQSSQLGVTELLLNSAMGNGAVSRDVSSCSTCGPQNSPRTHTQVIFHPTPSHCTPPHSHCSHHPVQSVAFHPI